MAPETVAYPRKTKRIERGGARGPYRSYSIEEKQHVVYLHSLGKMSFASISKELRIPQKNVVRWCREGLAGKPFNRRIDDSTRELKLWSWVNEEGSKRKLTFEEIQAKG